MQKVLTEVQQVLQAKLGVEIIPNGRYTLELNEVPLYAAAKGTYNKEFKACPIVVYNDSKWNVGYNQNDILAVGWWDSFCMDNVIKEWASAMQRLEVKKTNKKLAIASTLERKINLAIRHNLRGLREGWLEKNKNRDERYLIGLSPFKDSKKVSKSLHCKHSLEIDLHYENLEKKDVPFLLKMLEEPKYWWREYEKICLWNVIFKLIGNPNPEESIVLDEVTGITQKDVMPDFDVLKLLSFRGEYSPFSPERNLFYNWLPQPKEFKGLLSYIRKGFENGKISESYSYETVRHGTCYSGGSDSFQFILSLNGKVYNINFYGYDGGGNAYMPDSYKKFFSVTKSDVTTTDYCCDIDLDNEIIFKNLARLLRATLK